MELSGANNLKLARILLHEDRARQAIVPERHGVKNCLSNHGLVKDRDISHEKAILVVELFVPEIDFIPQVTQEAEESLAVFDALAAWGGSFRRTLFKDDFTLSQVVRHRRFQSRNCEIPIFQQFRVV